MLVLAGMVDALRLQQFEDPMGIYQKILSGKISFPKHFDKNGKVVDLKVNCVCACCPSCGCTF